MNNREMTVGRWREIEAVFEAALDLETNGRAAFLIKACGANEQLRREVERLLAAHDAAPDFLCRPATTNGTVSEHSGEQIDSYRLLRELGHGGMGTVWLAQRADGQFDQQVALKLIHTGVWVGAGNEYVRQRFRHERQILAGLNHPNIARLTDGGTTADGRPFFVMEYVEGEPLDEYCRARQLGLRERLQLFLQVCAAVQYAHQHLVIHRDLKPANILVTNDGTPKLLDFGIAKLLQPDLSQSYDTLPGTQPMTPAYASPEQVRGEKLTTASDVYSLGVVLYELLTGCSPYRLQADTLGELTRAVCEQDPTKPSTVEKERGTTAVSASQLRGDVDGIVLKALRKEPQARYQSVEQLAEDIRRYLAGLPTVARRGTFGYRAVKYVRRNRIPLTAATLVLLSLLGGIFATLRQARVVLAAQARAEAEQGKADTQRRRAEDALAKAEERRRQAEAARHEADEQRTEAEAQRAQADAQRTLADEQRALAEQQKTFADEQRARVETQELSNRRLLYTSRMGLAMQAWHEANVERMRDLLKPYLPQAGAPDFRGFEWYYLWKTSHQEEQTLPFPFAGPNDSVAFSPDGKQLLTVTQKRGDTIASVATEVIFRAVATGQVQHTLTLPPATIAVLSRDRKRLALARHFRAEISVMALPDGAQLHQITGLQGGLSWLDFTPDGRQLVAGFYDGAVSLIDAATEREVYRHKAHQQRVFHVAVAPDGQKFVSAGQDKVVRFWTLASGREFAAPAKVTSPQNALFSPDGRLVVVTGSGALTVWDTGGKELVQWPKRQGRRVVFTPDSRTLIVGGEDAERQSEITFLDTTTWQPTGVLRAHGNWIISLAVTPDGQRLASGSRDSTAKLWPLNRAGETTTLNDARMRGQFTQVVMTPDGKRLLIGEWRQIAAVWDVATARMLMELQGHAPPPNAANHAFPVAVSADGNWYATGGLDTWVKVWDAATGKEFGRFKMPTSVSALSFSPASNTLAAGCSSQAQLWEVNTKQTRGMLPLPQQQVRSLSFTPDGKSLFTATDLGIIKIWDLAANQPRQEFRFGEAGITAFALTRDGRSFAIGGGDGAARLCDAQTGRELLMLKGHSASVSAVAFSPDGRRLATGSLDRSVKLWDLTTGQELIALRENGSWIANDSVGFSSDGNLLFSADWFRQVKFWRAATELEVSARLQ